MLESLGPLHFKLVGGRDLGRRRDGLEFAPGRLVRQSHRVQRAAAGDFDFDGDGVTGGDVGGAGGERQGVIAYRTVEIRRHAFAGQGERLHCLRSGRQRELLLFSPSEEAERVERIALADNQVEGGGADVHRSSLEHLERHLERYEGIDGIPDLDLPMLTLDHLAHVEAISRKAGELKLAGAVQPAQHVAIDLGCESFTDINLPAWQDQLEKGRLRAGPDGLRRRSGGVENLQRQRRCGESFPGDYRGESRDSVFAGLAGSQIEGVGDARAGLLTVIEAELGGRARAGNLQVRDCRRCRDLLRAAPLESHGQGRALAEGDGIPIQRGGEVGGLGDGQLQP